MGVAMDAMAVGGGVGIAAAAHGMRLLDQDGLHPQQGSGEGVDRVLVKPGGDHAGDVRPLAGDLAQHRQGGGLQVQAPDAAVARVGPALDHAARLQPVDQAGDGDRLDLQQLRQLLLGDAGLAFEPDQDAPLGAGHVMRAGALVGVHPQQTGNVVQQEQQVALEFGQVRDVPRRDHLRDYKPRYDISARRLVMQLAQSGPS